MQNGGLFSTNRSYRAEAGFQNERVFRNVDNPNEIIIWGEATSGSKLRRALASPELKAAMKEAGGVAGTLKLHVIPYSSDAVIA
jgi:quinol monooxygenase YgiN